MAGTSVEERQSLEVVNRKKNVGKKFAGNRTDMISAVIMGNQSYGELKRCTVDRENWKLGEP